MKKQFGRIVSACSAVVIFMALTQGSVWAASGTLYLSPAAKTVYQGNNFTLGIRISTSDSINAVQANLSYPTDKLDYISTSFGGSAFEISAQTSGGNGSVQVARGTTGSVSGDKLVATVTFRAKKSSGSASVTVNSDSSLASNGSDVTSSKDAATINMSAAPAPAPEPPRDTTAPVISKLTQTDVTQNSFTLTWTTDEPSDSLVEYGLNNAYGLSVANSEKVTDHKVVVSSALITPDTKYQFRISSADTSGNKIQSKDQSIKSNGIPLKIVVMTSAKKPVKKAKVSIDGVSQLTDAKGVANFNVSKGNKTVVAALGDQTVTGSITIGDDNVGKSDTKLSLTLNPSSSFPYMPIGFIALFVAGVAVGHYVWRNHLPKWLPGTKKRLKKDMATMKLSDIEQKYSDKK